MSFFGDLLGGGGDDGSKEIRRQEEERQARIREGTNRINRIFGGQVNEQYVEQEPYQYRNINAMPKPVAGSGKLLSTEPVFETRYRPVTKTRSEQVPGQFTDDFYSGLQDTYLNYYKPQLGRQEADADRALKINLARSGNLTGSVGARQIGRLAEDKGIQERALSDNAIKFSNDARTRNEQTRGSLIGQLENGAGIDNVANQAAAAADTATAPPAFSPLGELFKNYTAAVANASVAAGNPGAFPGADAYRKSLLFGAGGNNSATVVN